MAPNLHPLIDNGLQPGYGSFNGGTLSCKCPSDKVAVRIAGDVAHNHACGCSKCWKPDGALFSIVGVVPVDKLNVVAHPEKLHIVDESATIQRHACRQCGTHMYGRIVKDHPFKGLDFVHVELSDQKGWQAPQFAAYVSSIIEQGYEPSGMDSVRGKFKDIGLHTYDSLSPPLMDAIAGYTAEKAGTAYKAGQPPAGASAKPVPTATAAKPQAAASTTPVTKPPSPTITTSATPSGRAPTQPPAKAQGGISGFFARLFGG